MHVMVDLETMSSRNDAAIVQIGAYPFDPEGDDVRTHDPVDRQRLKFHINVDLNSAMAYGLHVSGSTVYWWLQQSAAARGSLGDVRYGLYEALEEFAEWLTPYQSVFLWSHATFDVPILAHAYEVTGVQMPWRYRDARDVRTIVDLAGGIDVLDFPDRGGLGHVAWVDAWAQASVVQQAWKRLLLDA